MAIPVGQPAPDFTVPDQNGENVSLKDFRGKWVVLYSYPKDDTPGCTKEACQFTEALPQLQKLDCVVLGVSADTPESHRAFIEKFNLKIPLLADVEKSLLNAFGLYGEKTRDGKTSMGIHRQTYIIDPLGKVAAHWEQVTPDGHAAEVQGKLQQLRA